MESLEQFSSVSYYGNTLAAWTQALLTFALWFTVLPLARAFIARRVNAGTMNHPVAFLLLLHALLDATTRVFMIAVATYLALRWLEVPPTVDRFIETALLVIVWLQVGLWLWPRCAISSTCAAGTTPPARRARRASISCASSAWSWSGRRLPDAADKPRHQDRPAGRGLGIGGIAIALAVQNVLGDLFASLSIALDKPFRVGDALTVGDEKGTVEFIGIKSTRLRSVTGEQIIISNGDLLKSRVRNFSRLSERRADLQLRIAYETPHKLIAELPKIIERAIRAQENARFERAHFARYGDYALLFEATYLVETNDYVTFMDAQQAINLRLLDEFARRGITLAYPTTRSLSMTAPVAESEKPG